MNEKYMKIAINLALNGKDSVYPNPMVGCVIVKDSKIAGRGWHKYFGGAHAEVNAIADAGKNAKGADLFVTLEPCNSYGKRPPCVKAIIDAGIKRVFYAVKDPKVSKSAQTLRKAGIEVFSGLCNKEARVLIKDYLAHLKVKPKITVKAAMTLDGKIATRSYDSKWISSEKSRDYAHKLRTQYDAVLIGSKTAILDNPFLTAHNKGKNPIRVIIDFKLKIPSKHHLLDGSVTTFIICNKNMKKIPNHFKKEKINLIFLDEKAAKKDFNIIKNKLNDLGIKTILIEGGGEIISSALFSGAADDFYFFIAPKIIGGKNSVSVVGGAGVAAVQNALKTKILKVSKIDSDLLVFGKVLKI
ncbi:MAG: bifunctional diaminohydroxyphosphoribosylaminopyrimidine deaminase/5-amino-6-(5-phosphoribosylamino)uracil reductase RibD [Elusimicrobiota bacterium]|nr:bifunctional diaminohydroxyphosphoribosylaminopyrimidine deaminase/5-amino-6-(5-phosphoribosylamino)uracil reductase RibD [Elusimicrobiota bacterium]